MWTDDAGCSGEFSLVEPHVITGADCCFPVLFFLPSSDSLANYHLNPLSNHHGTPRRSRSRMSPIPPSLSADRVERVSAVRAP